MRPPRFNPLEAAQLGALCGFLLALGGLWIGVLHYLYGPLALVVLGGLAGWAVGIFIPERLCGGPGASTKTEEIARGYTITP